LAISSTAIPAASNEASLALAPAAPREPPITGGSSGRAKSGCGVWRSCPAGLGYLSVWQWPIEARFATVPTMRKCVA